MRILILCIVTFFATASSVGSQRITDFERYLKSLQRVSMPLTLRSSKKIVSISDHFDKILFNRFRNSWADEPYGKVFDSDTMVAILDLSAGDVTTPILTTFDRKGRKIDSLNLYKNAGSDVGYKCDVSVILNEKKQIILTDSIKRWALNKARTNIIPGTEKLTVKMRKYQINSSGKIVTEQPRAK